MSEASAANHDHGDTSMEQNEIESEKSSNQSVIHKNCGYCDANAAKIQQMETNLKEQLTAAQELALRYEKELSNERSFRKDLETKLTALSLEAETKIGKCMETNHIFEERLKLLSEKQEANMRDMQGELRASRTKCNSLAGDLQQLDRRYQTLLGINREKASEMREKCIELPQTMDQLQFLALQLREELIETRAAYEHTTNELRDELAVAREQLHDAERLLDESDARDSILAGGGDIHESAISTTTMSSNDIRYQAIIAELEHKILATQKERKTCEAALAESRRRCLTLQNELDTSEAVQRDFVKLSQQLQIQLEKLRQTDKEVRWQFEEDVLACNNCETQFQTKHVKTEKKHCRHCGKVFCANCLTSCVPCGPNGREAAVCDVCYTLLNRESIPFFSNNSNINLNHNK